MRDDTLFRALADVAVAQNVALPRSSKVMYPSPAESLVNAPLFRWSYRHRLIIEDFARFLTGMPHLVIPGENLILWVIECEYLRDLAIKDGLEVP